MIDGKWEGLSFDDVTLEPGKSEVLPSEVDVASRLTQNITLGIPILSAAMDTVTEARLAIALAQEGGFGVIHRNTGIDDQAVEVDRVKRSESGVIANPITLSPGETVGDAEDIMARYHISGIPITENGKLIGILTNRDIRFCTDMSEKIENLMTRENLITGPPGTTLEEAKTLLHKHRKEKLLIVDEEGQLRGLITIKDIQKAILYPSACKDELRRLRCGAAVGTAADTLDRAQALVDAGVDALVVDTAHGHSARVLDTVEKLRGKFPDTEVIAGNVAMAEGAEDLIRAGAQAVKVGMGPGSICTTRVISGVGIPQLTALMRCAEVCNKHDIPMIADGGIKFTGDITKALAAGASCVMIGGLFAGTDESPGQTVLFEGRTYKEYRGMGSLKAMQRGAADRYSQDDGDMAKLVPEGVEGRVPYKGLLSEFVHQLVGGLRSGMGYVGAHNLRDLQGKARFLRQSSSSVREGHPHDVVVTEDAPNYQSPTRQFPFGSGTR